MNETIYTVYTVRKSHAHIHPVSVLATDRIVRALEALEQATKLIDEAADFNIEQIDVEYLKDVAGKLSDQAHRLLVDTFAARTIEKHRQAVAAGGDRWAEFVDQANIPS